jgi:phage anti-repressor protein
MNELLKLDENGNQTVSAAVKLVDGEKVDARILWEELESKQQFGDWIKSRLSDFVENSDYEVIHRNMNNPTGGRPQIDYLLAINTATSDLNSGGAITPLWRERVFEGKITSII